MQCRLYPHPRRGQQPHYLCRSFFSCVTTGLLVLTVVFVVLTVLYATHLQSPERLHALSSLFGTNFCQGSGSEPECVRLSFEKDREQRNHEIAQDALRAVRVTREDASRSEGLARSGQPLERLSASSLRREMLVSATPQAVEYLTSLIRARYPACNFAKLHSAATLLPIERSTQFAVVNLPQLLSAATTGVANLTWWESILRTKSSEEPKKGPGGGGDMDSYSLYEWKCEQSRGGLELLRSSEVDWLMSLLNWTRELHPASPPRSTSQEQFTPPIPRRGPRWLYFLHGNSGDYKQARSLADHVRTQEMKLSMRHLVKRGIVRHNMKTQLGRSLVSQESAAPWSTLAPETRILTADFREEANIHRGRLVLAQSSFTARSLAHQYQKGWVRTEIQRHVEELEKADAGNAAHLSVESPVVWLVGHSMGGIVARLATLLLHTWTTHALVREWTRLEETSQKLNVSRNSDGSDAVGRGTIGGLSLSCEFISVAHCQRLTRMEMRNALDSASLCCTHMLRYILRRSHSVKNLRDATPVWIPHLQIAGVITINSPHRVPVIFIDRWMAGIFRALNNGRIPLAHSVRGSGREGSGDGDGGDTLQEADVWLKPRIPIEMELSWGTAPELLLPQPFSLSTPASPPPELLAGETRYISYNSGPRDLQVMYRLTQLCGASCHALEIGTAGAQHISTVSRRRCRSSLGHNEVLHDDCLQTDLARMLSNHMYGRGEEDIVSHRLYSTNGSLLEARFSALSCDNDADVEKKEDTDASPSHSLRDANWSSFSLFPVKMTMELHTWTTMASSILVSLFLALVRPAHVFAAIPRSRAVLIIKTVVCTHYSGLLFTFLVCHVRVLQWIVWQLGPLQMLGRTPTEYCSLPWIAMYIRPLELGMWNNDVVHFAFVVLSATAPITAGCWTATLALQFIHFLGCWKAKVQSRAANPVMRFLVAYSLLLIIEYGILRPTLIYRSVLVMMFCVLLRTVARVGKKSSSDADEDVVPVERSSSSVAGMGMDSTEGYEVTLILVFGLVFLLQIQPFFTIRNELTSKTRDRMLESVDPQWVAVEMMQHALILLVMHTLQKKTNSSRSPKVRRMSPFLLVLGALLCACAAYFSVFVLAAPSNLPILSLHTLTICTAALSAGWFVDAFLLNRAGRQRLLQKYRGILATLFQEARRLPSFLARFDPQRQSASHSRASTFRSSVVVEIASDSKETGPSIQPECLAHMIRVGFPKTVMRVYETFLMYFLVCVMAGNPTEAHSNASVGLLLFSPWMVYRLFHENEL